MGAWGLPWGMLRSRCTGADPAAAAAGWCTSCEESSLLLPTSAGLAVGSAGLGLGSVERGLASAPLGWGSATWGLSSAGLGLGSGRCWLVWDCVCSCGVGCLAGGMSFGAIGASSGWLGFASLALSCLQASLLGICWWSGESCDAWACCGARHGAGCSKVAARLGDKSQSDVNVQVRVGKSKAHPSGRRRE